MNRWVENKVAVVWLSDLLYGCDNSITGDRYRDGSVPRHISLMLAGQASPRRNIVNSNAQLARQNGMSVYPSCCSLTWAVIADTAMVTAGLNSSGCICMNADDWLHR